jgi:hypothetical protein
MAGTAREGLTEEPAEPRKSARGRKAVGWAVWKRIAEALLCSRLATWSQVRSGTKRLYPRLQTQEFCRHILNIGRFADIRVRELLQPPRTQVPIWGSTQHNNGLPWRVHGPSLMLCSSTLTPELLAKLLSPLVWGIELRASCLLGKHSTTYATPPSLFALVLFFR